MQYASVIPAISGLSKELGHSALAVRRKSGQLSCTCLRLVDSQWNVIGSFGQGMRAFRHHLCLIQMFPTTAFIRVPMKKITSSKQSLQAKDRCDRRTQESNSPRDLIVPFRIQKIRDTQTYDSDNYRIELRNREMPDYIDKLGPSVN